MRLLRWITVGASTIVMCGSVALSQDSPPQPVVQEAQEEPVARLKLSELTFGATSFLSDTSINQYARPLMGIGLHSLRYLSPLSETSPFARLIVRGMPDQDNYASVLFHLTGGRTALSAERWEYGHYVLDWRPKSESIDRAFTATLDQAIAPGIGGYLTYRSDRREGRYPAPRVADLTQTQTVSGGVGGRALGGNFGLSMTDKRTYTDTGIQPTTLQNRMSAQFNRDIGADFNLGGSASLTRIEQAGQPKNEVKNYVVSGRWEIDEGSAVQFQIGEQQLDLNSIQNAYVRKRTESSVRFLHRLSDWSLQLGYRHRESERVRSDQSYVDVPTIDSIDFRALGKVGAVRVTLKGSLEETQPNAVMGTNDPRQLYWDKRGSLQAKFDYAAESFVLYGLATLKKQQNNERDVEIAQNNIAVGGSYVYDEAISGFAEVSFEDYRVIGAGQSLDFYFPTAWTFATGVDWASDPSTWASANINFYENGDVLGTQLSFIVRRKISPDNDLEIIVAPWTREDRQLGLTGFHTTFLSVRYTVRF